MNAQDNTCRSDGTQLPQCAVMFSGICRDIAEIKKTVIQLDSHLRNGLSERVAKLEATRNILMGLIVAVLLSVVGAAVAVLWN